MTKRFEVIEPRPSASGQLYVEAGLSDISQYGNALDLVRRDTDPNPTGLLVVDHRNLRGWMRQIAIMNGNCSTVRACWLVGF